MQVPPYWCANKMDVWEAFVDEWTGPEWQATHEAARERRLMMGGAAHHQGSVPLATYAARYVSLIHFFILTPNSASIVTMILFRSQSAAHGGERVSTFQAWGLAHKGKATAPGLVFNLADGPDAYTNPLVHQKLTSYVEGVREVHGPEYDPTTEPIDADIVMRVGGGKKHGRHLIADSSITGSRRLSQIRAESTSGSLPIRERPTATQHIVSSLQVIYL